MHAPLWPSRVDANHAKLVGSAVLLATRHCHKAWLGLNSGSRAARPAPPPPITLQLRRTVLTLLHGTAGRQAAEALLVSRERFNKHCLDNHSSDWSGRGVWSRSGSLRPLDRRLLFEGGMKVTNPGRWARLVDGTDRAPFQW